MHRYRAGHDRIIDHMMMDGLEDAHETGRSMGDFGEATAEAYQFTRKDQDTYAVETLTRARKAVEDGAFRAEIAPVTLAERAGPRVIANDEHPLKVDPGKIPGLKPALRANGTITPAASSANADGAAALILAKRSLADRDGLASAAVKPPPLRPSASFADNRNDMRAAPTVSPGARAREKWPRPRRARLSSGARSKRSAYWPVRALPPRW